MATVYSGTKLAAGVIPKLLAHNLTVELSSYNIATGSAFVINDTVQMVKLPSDASLTNNGPVITTVVMDVPALDSSTGIVWAVGDSTTADRYITGATVGRSAAGGIQGLNNAGSLGYAPFSALFNTYTTISYQEYTITFKVTTAATGTAATTGTMTMKVEYTVDP